MAKKIDRWGGPSKPGTVERKLRLEIIQLETEVGELCKKVQALESELTLLRESKHATD